MPGRTHEARCPKRTKAEEESRAGTPEKGSSQDGKDSKTEEAESKKRTLGTGSPTEAQHGEGDSQEEADKSEPKMKTNKTTDRGTAQQTPAGKARQQASPPRAKLVEAAGVAPAASSKQDTTATS